MSSCPPPELLEKLAADSQGIAESIAQHVLHCQRCSAALDEIRQNNSLLLEITSLKTSQRSASLHLPAELGVDDYELLECIAQGGQGVVFRAIQKCTKRCVALKMLLGGHFATPRQRSRFEREVEVAACLRHPYIVTVHDSGITPDGRPFLSMEFIEGVPLDQWAIACRAERKGPETIRRLVGVFIKVCNGLSYAHLRGVLHRDLKPGNILVDSNDDPHIVDFGLAKLVDGEPAINGTVTGEFMGTVAYAAPEQVSSADCHADARSDVYALGVLLFEVLTGQLPYPVTGALAEVVQQITTADPLAPSLRAPSISADLDTITLKAMAKDANRRYQSARDLGEDLRRLLANEPISARSDSTWYVLRKTARRHRRAIVTVSLALLVLAMSAVAGGTYLILGARAEAARARSVAESERAEAISLVLRSASSPRRLNKNAEGYRSRDLARLEEQINLGWLAGNRKREAAVSSLLAAIHCKSQAPWSAEDLIRQAIMKRSVDADSNHLATAAGFSDLAEVLLSRLRLSEASHYCELAQRIDRHESGNISLETARDTELLARIRVAQRDFSAAVRLATDAAELQALKLGAENEMIARSLDTRSAALLASGDTEGAQRDCIQALRVRFILLQDEDSQVAQSLRRMAAVFDQRQEASQIGLFAKALGAVRPGSVADLIRKLASELDQLSNAAVDDHNSTRATLQRILSVKEAVLGANHKGLLSTLSALEVEATEISDYVEKLAILDRAARVIAQNYGAQSLPYANCLDERAEALDCLGRYSEALETEKDVLDIWLRLPIEHRDEFKLAVTERGIALWMMLDGQYEEAARHFAHCDEIIRRLHGPEHIISPYARAARAWLLVRLGRPQGMEQEAREAWAIADRLGPEMPEGQRGFVSFCAGSVLASMGNHDEGRTLMTLAWKGNSLTEGAERRPADDRYRRFVVEEMIRLCDKSGDIEAKARWRKELAVARQ